MGSQRHTLTKEACAHARGSASCSWVREAPSRIPPGRSVHPFPTLNTPCAEACFLASLPSSRDLQGSGTMSHTVRFPDGQSAVTHLLRGMPGRRAKSRPINTCLSRSKFSLSVTIVIIVTVGTIFISISISHGWNPSP